MTQLPAAATMPTAVNAAESPSPGPDENLTHDRDLSPVP